MENGSKIEQNKISCVSIDKWYEGEPNKRINVLEKINFGVKENELIVILGPAQSGKTTLLRIIAGLEMPSRGHVLLDGQKIKGPGSDRGMIFQKYSLFPWKNVLQNVELGPKLNNMPAKERREIAKHYINLVGLEGFENSYPYQLSGGMKQRVGIARAYINNPKVMLFDEPFGQLDAQTRYLMEEELIRIWETEKGTVLFVTNNIEEAIYLGDRVITLEGKLPGRIKNIYQVELKRPRDYTEPSFLELRSQITDETELVL